jgi:hypothetical protein
MGAPRVATPFPFFKETAGNSQCCGCDKRIPGAPSEIPQVIARNPGDFNTMPSSGFADNGHQYLKMDKAAKLEMFEKPIPIGTGQFRNEISPRVEEFYQRDRSELNLDLIHKDKH